MRFTKTEAWQHLANKKRDGESDLDDKFNVIRILRNHFGLYGLTGEILMIDSESCRCPDIMVKGMIPICIEMDGEIHGSGDQVSKRVKDVDRDKDYQSIGVKLVIINKELTNGYETKKVIKVLEDNGLKRIVKAV
jgi:hypothetical protein